MTGAEYDTRRRILGLSFTEAAAWHKVQDRTIRYWIADAGLEAKIIWAD